VRCLQTTDSPRPAGASRFRFSAPSAVRAQVASMSQHQDRYSSFPPPPPQHPSAPGSAGLSRSRPTSGLLSPLNTSFLHGGQGASLPQSQASTPVYGSHLSPGLPVSYSPRTPSALNPQTPSGLAPLPPHHPPPGSPPSTMEPYNPRQWNRGQVSGSQMVYQQRHSAMPVSTAHVTGMEGMFRRTRAHVHCQPVRCHL
jgi:hypothetical protein